MAINLDLNRVVPIYQEAIDSMIDQMGKEVEIHFDPTVTNVSQEFYDPIRGGHRKQPNHKADAENPAPTVVEHKKIIKALTKVNPSEFETFNINVKNPRGIVRLKTYATDIPDLSRCEFIIPNLDVYGIFGQKYKMIRTPTPVGLKYNRYALTYWNMV